MENRFGFKDLVLTVLMVVVIVMIGLGMYQVQRQAPQLQTIEGKFEGITSDFVASNSKTEAGNKKLRLKLSELHKDVTALTDQLALQQSKIGVLEELAKINLAQVGAVSSDQAKQIKLLNAITHQGIKIKGSGEAVTKVIETSSKGGVNQYQAMLKELKAREAKIAAEIKNKRDEAIRLANYKKDAEGLATDPFYRISQMKDQKGYTSGDWYVTSFAAVVPTLTPLISSDLYASIVQSRIFETLITRDPETLKYRGLLAESWVVDNEKDEITFKLRKEPRFSSGKPFTSADIVFTYRLIMNKKIRAARTRGSVAEYIKDVVAIDKHTVKFIFKKKYFDSLALAGEGFFIVSKEFYSKYTEREINQTPGLVMGTGPYKLKDPRNWQMGDLITLYPNNRYWGPSPSFDRILYHSINENQTRKLKFINGELDVFGALAKDFEELRNDPKIMARAREQILKHRRQGYMYIAWNQERDGKKTVFADKRVRQAMAYLIDRQRICDVTYRGYATVTSGPFNEMGDQDDPNIKPRKVDVKKAVALLTAAGFKDTNNDKVLEGPDGKDFVLNLVYGSGSPEIKRMMLGIRDDLERANIKVLLNPTKWSILIKKLDTRDYDAISLRWASVLESDIHQMFHSSQRKDGDNFIGYKNDELDKLLVEAREETDYEKRMVLWKRAHQILYEDQPYLFMVRSKSLSFIAKRFENVKRTDVGQNFVGDWPMQIPFYVTNQNQKYQKN